MLSLYRRLIAARRDHLDAAGVELLDTDDAVVVLRRGEVVVACNTGARAGRGRRRGRADAES